MNHGVNVKEEMRMSTSTELKVGAFAITGIAALVVMTVALEGNPFTKRPNPYYTQLDNVGGIGVRTQVRVSGVQVGEVTSIDVLPNGARVNFQIKGDIDIPEGSFLEIRSRGILGDVFLELVRNTFSPKILKAGSLIPKRVEANDFNSLMALVGSIARDLQSVSRSMAVVFGSTDGQSSLQNILHNVEKITADARDIVDSQRYNIAKAIQGLRDSATQLSDIMQRNNGRVDEAIQSAAAAAKDVQYFTSEIKRFVSGENRDKFTRILDSIDTSAGNIKEAMGKVQLIVDKVNRGEGTLGQIVAKDETANDLRQTLRSVQELLAPARRLQIEVDYKGEYRDVEPTTRVGSMGNHFNVRLSTRPDQFYLLGVSDSPLARSVSTTTTTTTTSNTGAVTRKIERAEKNDDDDRGWLRLNAQFAKRFSPVGLRFGLFESYPGLAADAYLFNDRLTASVEAFQFADKPTNDRRGDPEGVARVKAYGNFFFTPNLYLTGGVDGIGRDPGPFGFFGGGLRFTDDDLKTVLGAAAIAK